MDEKGLDIFGRHRHPLIHDLESAVGQAPFGVGQKGMLALQSHQGADIGPGPARPLGMGDGEFLKGGDGRPDLLLLLHTGVKKEPRPFERRLSGRWRWRRGPGPCQAGCAKEYAEHSRDSFYHAGDSHSASISPF